MRNLRIIGGIFLMVGLLVFSIGGYFFWGTQDLLSSGERSIGEVIEMRRSGSNRYQLPIVQFKTTDNRTITASSKTGSNPPTHKVGDTVTVIYRAADPESICLDEPLELWLLPGILGGIGGVFVIIGGGMWIFSTRR